MTRTLPEYIANFETPRAFLDAWERDLQHGGMMLPPDAMLTPGMPRLSVRASGARNLSLPPPTPIAPQQDMELKVKLRIPMASDPLSLLARVVFIGPAGIGLQFTQMNSELRANLQLFADRCRTVASMVPTPPPVASAGSPPGVPVSEGAGSFPLSTMPLSSARPAVSRAAEISVPAKLAATRIRVPLPDSVAVPVGRPDDLPSDEANGSIPLFSGDSAPTASPRGASPGNETKEAERTEHPKMEALFGLPVRTRLRAQTSWHPTHHNEPDTPAPRKTLEGSLESLAHAGMDLPAIALELSKHHATGLLLIQNAEHRREVFFQTGLVSLTQEDPRLQAHLLGEVLVEQSLIRHADLAPALKAARQQNMLLGQYLIREHILEARELAYGLRRQSQVRLWSALSIQSGKYAVWEHSHPTTRPTAPPISVEQTVWREKVNAYRTALADEFDAHINPILDRFLHRAADAPEDLAQYGLNDEEQRFWNLIVVGQYSVREVFQVSPTTRMRTYGALLALLDLKLARLDTDMAQRWKESHLRDKLLHKLNRVEHGTLFTVLELHWSATDAEVKAAHEKLLAEYDLSHLTFNVADDLVPLANAILKRCEEAYQALKTLPQRMKYRREILEASQLGFASNLLHDQADMHFYRGAYQDAYQAYARALELQPDNHELQRKVTELGNRLRSLT